MPALIALMEGREMSTLYPRLYVKRWNKLILFCKHKQWQSQSAKTPNQLELVATAIKLHETVAPSDSKSEHLG